jgi:hypothetical protein
MRASFLPATIQIRSGGTTGRSRQGFPDHRPPAREVEELLRAAGPAFRPEARPRAAGQHDRVVHRFPPEMVFTIEYPVLDKLKKSFITGIFVLLPFG